MMKGWIIVWLCVFMSLSTFAQQQQQGVTLYLDTSVVFIGDLFSLDIVAVVPSEQLLFSEASLAFSSIEQLEIVEELPIDLQIEGDWKTFKKRILMRIWEPGRYRLPSVSVQVPTSSDTLQLTSSSPYLTVLAPQITGDSNFIADIKPLFAQKLGFWENLLFRIKHPLFLLLVALLLLFMVCVLLVYRSKQNIAAPSLEDKALSDLASLKQHTPSIKNNFKPLYAQLSYIWRWYLSQRFHLKTLQHPLDASMHDWDGLVWMTEEEYNALTVLLSDAALIKFAKACPVEGAFEQDLELSIQIISSIQGLLEAQIDRS